MSVDKKSAFIECVYDKIYEQYKVKNDINDLEIEQRTVLLIWESVYIIENGGFRYLFEDEFPGDIGYSMTLDSYKAVCKDAYKLLQEVFGIFPNMIPPSDIATRISIYKNIDESVRDEYNRRFFRLSDLIANKLYQYIVKHRDRLSV